MPSPDELQSLMERVRKNPEDFDAFKKLALLFHNVGKTDSAKQLALELHRNVPNDPDIPFLFRTLDLNIPVIDTMIKWEFLFRDHPEQFRNNSELVLQALQDANPETHADLVGRIVGEYLDEHLEDAKIRLAWQQFETMHFTDLYKRSRHFDPLFRNKQYRVTCIVSTYNSAAFIKECLEDLVAQTIFPDLEILIIDACSPQNELEIAKPFLERYDNIRYIITPYRIGIYPAWTMGCLLANAPYITPFSANDRLLPHAYQIMADALDKNQQATLVYGDSYLTDQPHQSIGSHSPSHVNGGYFRWPEIGYGWLMLNCGIGPQPMWRKSCHTELGFFDRRYKATGDQDFFLRHARRAGLLHIPQFTGMAWITDDSLSGHPSAHAETFNIQLKHFKATKPLLDQDSIHQIHQVFLTRFHDIIAFLNQSGNREIAEVLYIRHRDFFA